MNFCMKHAPGAGSITLPVDLQSSMLLLCIGCPPEERKKRGLGNGNKAQDEEDMGRLRRLEGRFRKGTNTLHNSLQKIQQSKINMIKAKTCQSSQLKSTIQLTIIAQHTVK